MSLDQCHPQAKVLVGDNSTKPFEYNWHGKNTEYLRLPPDYGLSATRNYLVDEAGRQGYRHVLCFDDDFTCTPDSNFQELWGLLPKCDIASGHMQRKHRPVCAGRFEQQNGQFVHHLWQHDGFDPRQLDFGGTLIMARVETLQRCRFDDRLKLGEHFDFYQRAYAQGLTTLVVPRVMVLDGGEDDGREDAEYMEARGRGREFFRQGCYRWKPVYGPVEYRPPGVDHGVDIPDPEEIPSVPACVPESSTQNWPSLGRIFDEASAEDAAHILRVLKVYEHGGLSSWTEKAVSRCGRPGVEAFLCPERGWFGAVAGHPWLGEWLRMMPAAWRGCWESVGILLAMAAREKYRHGGADLELV
jgi:hypothetical protein